MSTDIDRPGTFRGRIVEYGLPPAFDSGAVAVNVVVALDAQYNDETSEWDDWTAYDVTANGMLFVIKSREKGGGLNESQVNALREHCGWDGNLDSVWDGSWQPTPCGFTIGRDDYKSKKTNTDVYRVNWINDYENTGSGVGAMSSEQVKALQAQYGGQFRALAGNAARNAAPPEGAPAKAPPAPKVEPKPKPSVGDGPGGPNDIPF